MLFAFFFAFEDAFIDFYFHWCKVRKKFQHRGHGGERVSQRIEYKNWLFSSWRSVLGSRWCVLDAGIMFFDVGCALLNLGGVFFELGGVFLQIGGVFLQLWGLNLQLGGLNFHLGGLNLELGGLMPFLEVCSEYWKCVLK